MPLQNYLNRFPRQQRVATRSFVSWLVREGFIEEPEIGVMEDRESTLSVKPADEGSFLSFAPDELGSELIGSREVAYNICRDKLRCPENAEVEEFLIDQIVEEGILPVRYVFVDSDRDKIVFVFDRATAEAFLGSEERLDDFASKFTNL